MRTAARISAIYAGAAGVWILMSDTLLGKLSVVGALPLAWGLGKGLFFVALTTALLYLALRDILGNAAHARTEVEKLTHQLEFALAASQGATWQYELPTQSRRLEDGVLRPSARLRTLLGDGVKHFGEWLERVHPDDRATVHQRMQHALAGGAAEIDLQHRLRFADGAYRTILIRGRPDPSALIWHGVILDVTEHTRSRERLALLGRLFEASSEGIVVTDGHGVITACNPAAQNMLGAAGDDLVGLTIDQVLLGSLSTDERDRIWRVIGMGERWQGRAVLAIDDRRSLRLSLRLSPVRKADGSLDQVAALIFDVTEIEQIRERIRDLQDVDALTGLPTTTRFLQRIDDQLQHHGVAPRGMHLVVCDILGFHAINETYGRDAGDSALRAVSERLHATAPPGAMLARVAGNSFALAFPGPGEAIESTVGRLRSTLGQPLGLGAKHLYLDCAFGSSLFPSDAANAEELLQHAQTALHEAKRHGRRAHRRYTTRLSYNAQDRLQLIADLRDAVDRHELSCYFQPKVRLGNRDVVGAEALLRWEHHGQLLLPGRFLRYAQEAGLMAPIGSWMLRAALTEVARWQTLDRLPRDFRVAVNIAQDQIGNELPTTVVDTLSATGLPASMLELEFTEDIVDAAWDKTRRVVRDLRDLGVAIALDDFGTGYSSLARLKHLHVDTLKIDQSFTRDLDHAGSAAVVASMVTLGHKLGCALTAEGVETSTQHEQLTSTGCDYGQGFLFGRAVGAEDFLHVHLGGAGPSGSATT